LTFLRRILIQRSYPLRVQEKTLHYVIASTAHAATRQIIKNGRSDYNKSRFSLFYYILDRDIIKVALRG
jgi:hypothetical protein